ncbi:MAG: HDOD domain-containing protein [Deltaproteobacteria bacterium]|nr:HDOD domain-containing protein [Deltaproteobacteria bacterium]
MAKTDNSDITTSFSALAHLNDLEREELYRVATIRKIEPDEIIITEGAVDRSVYLLLDGEISIIKDIYGQPKLINTLQAGALIGEIAFTKSLPRTATAFATRDSHIMIINEATFQQLGEQTQVLLLKLMNDLGAERIHELAEQELKLAQKNRALLSYIQVQQQHSTRNYGSAEMLQRIISNVPRLPAYASDLIVRLQYEGISQKEIAELISTDPSLMATLLKRVNSPFYGFQKKVSDLNHAIVLLGINQVYQLVIGEGISHIMPERSELRTLQAHSVAISNIAQTICEKSGMGKPAQIAAIGLLHGLGASVIGLLKEKNPQLSLLIESLDQAKIGSVLLKAWDLPDVVWQSIEYQRYPEFTPPAAMPEDIVLPASLLYVSELCYLLLQGSPGLGLPVIFLDEYMEFLHLQPEELNTLVKRDIVPHMLKKMASFPAALRQLLHGYLERSGN